MSRDIELVLSGLSSSARARTHARPVNAAPFALQREPRYHCQAAHLTCPATVWKYVEKAVTGEHKAQLVMLDLEDSIPRDDAPALARGRENVIRALRTLDWSSRLRYFRPRGTQLDPGLTDIVHVVQHAGDRLDGLVIPKVEHADEVQLIDHTLSELERVLGLESNSLAIQLLIESVHAEQQLQAITAAAPNRVAGLIFGAFDYWSSLGMGRVPYRVDHPLITDARCNLVKAAASAGVPAIAEMTLDFPTRDKSPEQQRAALDTCRRDAELARDFGFTGKWSGIPPQADIIEDVFALSEQEIARSIRAVRAFAEAERSGRGAIMIDGAMADRATDRVHRTLLTDALIRNRLDPVIANELGISRQARST